MKRREFIVTAGAGAAAIAAGSSASTVAKQSGAFKLQYAPHFGMFKNLGGDDPVDQLKFAADEGFTAWEDNGMAGRSTSEQQRIAKAMDELDIEMGVFVAHAEWREPIYARSGAETRKHLQDQMRQAIDVAKRVNATWCTIVPGPYDKRLEWNYQTANVVDCLKAMAEICEPAGLIMVLEPLNPYRDHPGMFLTKIPQAYQICKAANSPFCKILDDLYHQQVTEGNLIPNIDQAYGEIAYFQVGDNPGRNEPGTGEINYRNVFKHIYNKNFTGVVGMEHGNSRPGKQGERAVINAYRHADSF